MYIAPRDLGDPARASRGTRFGTRRSTFVPASSRSCCRSSSACWPLGLARARQRELVPRRRRGARDRGGLPMIDTPTVDWLALSPDARAARRGRSRAARRALAARVDAQGRRRSGRRSSASSSPRPRRLGVRRQRDAGGPARRLDGPRPARRARAGHARRSPEPPSSSPPGASAGARTTASTTRCSRPPERGWPSSSERREPDDAVPRARVVLALPLHPRRARHRLARLARGGPEVPHRRRLRVGGAPLRLRARLRRDGRARLRRDRGGRRGETTPSSSPGSR